MGKKQDYPLVASSHARERTVRPKARRDKKKEKLTMGQDLVVFTITSLFGNISSQVPKQP
jgi:hypothetical protein